MCNLYTKDKHAEKHFFLKFLSNSAVLQAKFFFGTLLAYDGAKTKNIKEFAK